MARNTATKVMMKVINGLAISAIYKQASPRGGRVSVPSMIWKALKARCEGAILQLGFYNH